MGQVFPFRNVRGPSEETPCQLCEIEIAPREGYAVIFQGVVDGYVCERCFTQGFEPVDDHVEHVHLLNLN